MMRPVTLVMAKKRELTQWTVTESETSARLDAESKVGLLVLKHINRLQPDAATQDDLEVKLLKNKNMQFREQVPEKNMTIGKLASKIDTLSYQLMEFLMVHC